MTPINVLARRSVSMLFLVVCLLAATAAIQAQTSAFTYQGRFTDTSVTQPTNGTYNMQFALFGSLNSNDQIGTTITNSNVQVVNGLFTVSLNFTAADAFNGAARYLEISVFNQTANAYIRLDPRQLITSSPYSIRTINANFSDALSTACVGCVDNAKIASIDGAKITGTVANANTANTATTATSATTATTATSATTATTAQNVSGIVAVANGGTGSSTKNFVDLSTDQTITGNKTFTGTLSGAGITSLLRTYTFAGSSTTSIGTSSAYVFNGPATSVTVGTGQRITGAASAVLGKTTGDPNTADIGLCYQSSSGVITNFAGGNYMTVQFSATRQTYSATASVTGLTAGTYNVGFCVRNTGATAINNNDFVNGWVMVTNN